MSVLFMMLCDVCVCVCVSVLCVCVCRVCVCVCVCVCEREREKKKKRKKYIHQLETRAHELRDSIAPSLQLQSQTHSFRTCSDTSEVNSLFSHQFPQVAMSPSYRHHS